MDLEFTADQEDLRANVAEVLSSECPRSLPRAVTEGTGDAGDLWRHMVDLGWTGLTIAESEGGIGLGPIELAIVCEESGRRLAPTPFLATVGQFAPMLRVFEDSDRLRRVAAGDLTGTLALGEPTGGFGLDEVHAIATPNGDGFVLEGTKTAVLDGDRADEIVVVARTPGSEASDGIGVFLVERDAVDVRPVPALDATRPVATIGLDGVAVESADVLATPGPESASLAQRALDEATMAIAVELVGVTGTLFEDTLAYANEREQFGVPIGSFQAIKHKLADMFVLLERARATAYFAALTLAEGDERASLATSVAKAAAGEAAERIAAEAIQTHGGIGYTWEHDTHLFVRRAITNEALGGSAADHRDAIATAIGLA